MIEREAREERGFSREIVLRLRATIVMPAACNNALLPLLVTGDRGQERPRFLSVTRINEQYSGLQFFTINCRLAGNFISTTLSS